MSSSVLPSDRTQKDPAHSPHSFSSDLPETSGGGTIEGLSNCVKVKVTNLLYKAYGQESEILT